MNQALRKELLVRGLSDMLQLGEMAWAARRLLGGSPSKADIVRATTEAIGKLVSSGYAIVGDVVKDEGLLCVRPWELSPVDMVKRIEDEWGAIEGLPNLGEVCWLELTDAGRAEARAVSS